MKLIKKIEFTSCSTQNPSESKRKNRERIKKEEKIKKIEEESKKDDKKD